MARPWHADPNYEDKAKLRLRANYVVNRETTCWDWIGGTNGGNYGQMGYRGRTHTAHRISYLLFVGDIGSGLHIDHLCSNTLCVNPDHLEPVTPSENVRRGYERRPEVPWSHVAQIRSELTARIDALAEQFCIGRIDVARIAIRRDFDAMDVAA